MSIFSRKKNAGWGRDAIPGVFDDALTQPLLEAVDATSEAFGSAVAERLADEVVPGRFKGSRSAVNSLRREGLAGLPAIPIIAAWVESSLGRIPDDWAGYGVREGMLTLADFRKNVRARSFDSDGPAAEAITTFEDFLEGHVVSVAIALLNGPNGRACRGSIGYLRGVRRSPQRAVDALTAYLDNHPGETGDGDLDAARGDAIYALQELSERVRATERTVAQSPVPATPPPERPSKPEAVEPASAEAQTAAPDFDGLSNEERADRATAFIGGDLVPRLRSELRSSSANARLAALAGLSQLGDSALVALPDVWAIANDDRLDEGMWASLRERALLVATQMAARAQRAERPPSPATDPRIIELLMGRALSDPESRVRAESIRALVGLPTDEDLGEIIEEGLRDEDPDVRLAAIELLREQAEGQVH